MSKPIVIMPCGCMLDEDEVIGIAARLMASRRKSCKGGRPPGKRGIVQARQPQPAATSVPSRPVLPTRISVPTTPGESRYDQSMDWGA